MVKRNNNSALRESDSAQILPPRFVIKGRQELATYLEQEVPEYRDNPLIESLPPIWTRNEVEERLAHFPPYSNDQRQLPAHIRLHLIDNTTEFFIPQAIDFEIETRISCMMRRGYLQRNPMTFDYWPDVNERLNALKPANSKVFLKPKARGFAVVGDSGMGKTTATETILMQYPQVIGHSNYKGREFILKQLVWLKQDCPQDGSIKGLCQNFFETVDDILGTNYYKNYAAGRSTVDLLVPRMARVAAIHSLGVFVVDEIESLSAAKSGGASQMLNFFVQLENNIGVPFILIGTAAALHLFKGEFRQARRASEQGDVMWPRMSEIAEPKPHDTCPKADYQWEEFIRALWAYYYLREPSPLKDDLLKDRLSHALYDVSQGITSVAGTVYKLAQRRAITSGVEKLTAGIIRTVARDSQRLIGKMLDDLRSGIIRGPYSAIDLIDTEQSPPEKQQQAVASPRKVGTVSHSELMSNDVCRNDTDLAGQTSSTKRERPAGPKRKRAVQRKISPKHYDKDDLRSLSAHGGENNSSNGTAQTRHIRSLT